MTIESIYKNKGMTLRSYHLCIKNQIKTLECLLTYYLYHGTFRDFFNCGNKSDLELISLCKNYKQFIHCPDDKVMGQGITLFEYQEHLINDYIQKKTKELPQNCHNRIIRIFNVEPNLLEFAEFFIEHDFYKLKWNENEDKDTEAILNNYLKSIQFYILKIEHFDLIINELSKSQSDIINNYILCSINKLSRRLKHIIIPLSNNDLSLRSLIFYIPQKIKKTKVVGLGGIVKDEFYSFLLELSQFILKISNIKEAKNLLPYKNRFLIQVKYGITYMPLEFLNSESIFIFANFILHENILFSQIDTRIFVSVFNIYNTKTFVKRKMLCQELQLSSEAIRLKKKICLAKLFNGLSVLREFDDDLDKKYGLDTRKNQIVIDDNLVSLINEKNRTNFTKNFIVFIVYVYKSEQYDLIGDISRAFISPLDRACYKNNMHNLYLVKKNLKFDFNAFYKDLYALKYGKIKLKYLNDFKISLTNFMEVSTPKLLNKIIPIAENILNEECNLI